MSERHREIGDTQTQRNAMESLKVAFSGLKLFFISVQSICNIVAAA